MFNWIRRSVKRWLSYEDAVNSSLVEPMTRAGVHVTEDSSLSLTSVFCAVSTISSMIAGLPLSLYQHLPSGGKRESQEHPLYPLLSEAPNPEITKEQYWQTSLAHALLWGNSYAEIERDEAGRAVALWLIPPESVKVCRDPELGLVYAVKVASGQDVYLPPENVFHYAGLSHDGLVGHSPVALARQSLSLTLACEQFGASFFGNAARPAGVLQSPLSLSDNARENLRKSWESLHSGSGNTGRTAILEEGVTWSAVSIPAEDAQFLQTRQYQIQEVARLFNISSLFLHDGPAAWTDLETINRQLVQITLLPWLNKIEAEGRRKLLSAEERPGYFLEHDVTSLLRADTTARYAAYATAIQSGWMLRSEARAAERLDPIEGLDEPVLPTKVQTVDEDSQPTQEDNGDASDTSDNQPISDR